MLPQPLVKAFQRIKGQSSVHGQDLAHPKNEHLRLLVQALQGTFELVGRAEEKRTEDAKDRDARRGCLCRCEGMVIALGFRALVLPR